MPQILDLIDRVALGSMTSSDYCAANLRRLRDERGLTQAQLAEAAKLEMATVYQYEAGKRRPKLGDSLDALAAALGVEPFELLIPPGTKLRGAVPSEVRNHIAAAARACGLKVSK